MRAFISSTAVDLMANRAVAQQVVLEHGWQPVMLMEHKAVPGGLTVPACQQLVQSCDLFILIAGHRCGWIPPHQQGGDGVSSITQLEFAAWGARAKVRPTMAPIILLAADPAPPVDAGQGESELARASQMVFRARLKSTHIVHEFPFATKPPNLLATTTLVQSATKKLHDDALREFRVLLSSLLSKVKSAIADRTVAQAQTQIQEAKSSGWVLGALGVGLGLLIASNKGDDNGEEYDEEDKE